MARLQRLPWFVIGLLTISLSLFPASASAGAIINLNPEQGTCTDRILFEGLAYPPRSEVALSIRQMEPFSDLATQFATITISPEGAIVVVIPVKQMIPQCATATPPAAGTRYVITVTPSGKNPQGIVYDQATFTLTEERLPGLPNTGGGWAAASANTQVGAAVAFGLLAAAGTFRRRRIAQLGKAQR